MEPRMCRNCNSLVCQECIDHLTNSNQIDKENLILCVACEQVLSITDIQRITKKGLEVLLVKCPSNNINCYEEFELKDLNNHLQICKFFEGKATCSACELVDYTSKIQKHVEVCPDFFDECKYCSELYLRKEIKIHEKTCFKKPRLCKMCSTFIDDENIHFHPTKDICMINIVNEIKEQIEKKIDMIIESNKERDGKMKMIEVIEEDLNLFKLEAKAEIKDIREKADKTDMLVEIQGNIEKLFKSQDDFREKLNLNSTEIQKINSILLDYNAAQIKRDTEVKDIKKRLDDSQKKLKDVQNQINFHDDLIKNLRKSIDEKDGKILDLRDSLQILRNNWIDRDNEFQEIRAKLEQNMKAIQNIGDPKFIRDIKISMEETSARLKSLDEHLNDIQLSFDRNKQETIDKINKNVTMIDTLSHNINGRLGENDNKMSFLDEKMLDLDTYIKDFNKKLQNNAKNKGKIKILDKQLEGYFCIKTLSGHSHYVNCLIYAKLDKLRKFIVTGSGDNTIKVWDINSGVANFTLEGHSAGVFAIIKIKWDNDNYTIASGSADKTIKLWNLETKDEIRTISGHAHAIYCLERIKWEKDKTTIASGSGDYTIKLWNIETGLCLKTLAVHSNIVVSIKQIKWARDETTLVSGSWDNKIYLWDFNKGSCIKAFTGHTHWVSSVIYMKIEDDQYSMISGSYDYSIKVWNINSGICIKTLDGHSADVLCLAQLKWAKDEHTILSGSADKSIKFWNIQSGVCFKTLFKHTDPVFCVIQIKMNEDQTTIASGSGDYSIKLWN